MNIFHPINICNYILVSVSSIFTNIMFYHLSWSNDSICKEILHKAKAEDPQSPITWWRSPNIQGYADAGHPFLWVSACQWVDLSVKNTHTFANLLLTTWTLALARLPTDGWQEYVPESAMVERWSRRKDDVVEPFSVIWLTPPRGES